MLRISVANTDIFSANATQSGRPGLGRSLAEAIVADSPAGCLVPVCAVGREFKGVVRSQGSRARACPLALVGSRFRGPQISVLVVCCAAAAQTVTRTAIAIVHGSLIEG